MGRRGQDYGSEHHLRTWLRERPEVLSAAVGSAIGWPPQLIEWLPYRKHPTKDGADCEYGGIDFLPPDERTAAVNRWREFWPQTGTPPKWDAVGRTAVDWLLVEAKANATELRSSATQAKGASRDQIDTAM